VRIGKTSVKIGIAARLSASDGGRYQFSLAILDALSDWNAYTGNRDELVLVTNDVSHPVAQRLQNEGWSIAALPAWSRSVSGLGAISAALRNLAGDKLAWALYRRLKSIDLDDGAVRPAAHQYFSSLGVDLVLYANATPLSYRAGVPFLMAVLDIQHRINPQFPEVGANGQWEGRERLYRNAVRSPFALGFLSDAETGREDILDAYGPYGLTADRVKILPLTTPPYLHEASSDEVRRIKTKYRLPDSYLFYPAQFWPHKNHLAIVEALQIIQQKRGLRVSAVFSGSHEGRLRTKNYRNIMTLSRRLGVEDRVHFIGYVADEDMAALYSGAVALLMPTYFGPTNIPVVEAWQCGCPVITSDVRGIREHAGDAAVLVRPDSPESIAEGILALWTDEKLRESLRTRGRRRLTEYSAEEFKKRLVTILKTARDAVSSQAKIAEPTRI
jgi:glycosyltransferase involved in cell wall biosynthesis